VVRVRHYHPLADKIHHESMVGDNRLFDREDLKSILQDECGSRLNPFDNLQQQERFWLSVTVTLQGKFLEKYYEKPQPV
jgi:hypothetical protein